MANRLEKLESMFCKFLEQSSSTPQQVQTPTSAPIPCGTTPNRVNTCYSEKAGDTFDIPLSVIKEAAQGCRSRRNMAGRLADLLFTREEKLTSNYRGVLKKKRLDLNKTSAIKQACTAEFPGKQHETERMIDKEIREGVDEMCRRAARKSITVIN